MDAAHVDAGQFLHLCNDGPEHAAIVRLRDRELEDREVEVGRDVLEGDAVEAQLEDVPLADRVGDRLVRRRFGLDPNLRPTGRDRPATPASSTTKAPSLTPSTVGCMGEELSAAGCELCPGQGLRKGAVRAESGSVPRPARDAMVLPRGDVTS